MLTTPAAALALARQSCGLAAARAAVKRAPLVIPASQSISSESYRVPAADIDGAICLPLPGGGTALVVTVGSGGTAGDIDWAIYVPGKAGYNLSLVRGGYKLGLVRTGSDVVETDPVYRKNDPNCCPSGGFDHTRWHWNGTRFTAVRRWHNKTYQP